MATEKAMFGAGCFWGVEATFRRIKGVKEAIVGYAGGKTENPTYQDVCSDETGHAEVVEVEFDPAVVSYDQLLDVFWANHDPTTLNRQGPDVGTQYRSAIYYATDEQRRVAEAYIDQLNRAKVFPRPIVTEVVPLDGFYPAEAYHQNYAVQHPNQLYIVLHDRPKVERLRRGLPELYRDSRVP